MIEWVFIIISKEKVRSTQMKKQGKKEGVPFFILQAVRGKESGKTREKTTKKLKKKKKNGFAGNKSPADSRKGFGIMHF